MTLAAGRLRHRVLIEHYVLDVDSNGDVIQDPETGQTTGQWLEFATVYAAIEPLSTKEFIESQSKQTEMVARIIIRSRPGLDSAMRLVHMINGQRGRIYDPHGFLPDKDSGLEYVTAPVSYGLVEDQAP